MGIWGANENVLRLTGDGYTTVNILTPLNCALGMGELYGM